MKIRRNFSFWPGEKSWLNRAYRALSIAGSLVDIVLRTISST